MKGNIKSTKRKLLFPFLFMCLFLMGMHVSAEETVWHEGIELTPDYRFAREIQGTEEPQQGKSISTVTTVVSATNSELDPPQKWEIRISRDVIIGTLEDDTVSEECYWALMIYSSNDTQKVLQRSYDRIAEGPLLVDISTLPEGDYYLTLWRGEVPESKAVTGLKVYPFTITEDTAYFDSANYEKEQFAWKQVTARMDPEVYNQIPEIYYTDAYEYQSELSNIIETANSITSECTNDEEKLQAVHDWICSSVAYDYDVIDSGDKEAMEKENNPFYVYKYARGICGGYSRLMQIILTSVGVPCIYIEGYGADGSGDTDKTNHAWNMVWIDGVWRTVDVTWDCKNEYENSETKENAAVYAYYAEPVFFFACEHQSHYRYTYQYVKSISISNAPTKTFQKGDSFSVGNGTLQIEYGDGSTKSVDLKSSMCSGYDMDEYGSQTVTVSYAGASAEYTIQVVPVNGAGYTVGDLKYRITKAAASGGTAEVYSAVSTGEESLSVPQSVTIKGYVFTVTGIATKAFQNCKNLKKLVIRSASISEVGSKAFLGLKGSAKIYVPSAKYTAYKKLMTGKGQTSNVTIKKY